MNDTTVPDNSTLLSDILGSNATTSGSPSTTLSTSTLPPSTTTQLDIISSTSIPRHADGSSVTLFLFSFVLFIVAIALIAKVLISKKKRRDIIGGTARWRLSASSQSGAPMQTNAAYAPVNGQRAQNFRNPMDAGGGENRLDWERQFFADPDNSSQEQSRLRLDFNRM